MDLHNGKECGSIDSLEFDGNTVLCRVCGDKASGFHYGVHACEGCKGFFRRSIQQKIQYRPCLKNQQCSIMRVNRNRCQYCRLKKCIAVGMSRDAVRFGRVPKREKAKIIEQMQKVNAQSQVSVLNSLLENENDVIQKIMDSHFRLCDFTHSKFVQFFEKAWAEPRFVDCPAHKACPLNPTPSEQDSMSQWDEFSNCFTPAIRNVVYFAKCIPGFSVFSQEDQVTLLKAGTFEVLLVHLAPLFDSRTNTMLFANGTLYKRSAHTTNTNAGFLLDSMFDFADHLNELKLKDEEIGLFSALVIIASDRLGLRYADQVARLQSTISKGLQKLVQINHPDDPSIFSRLLMKIPDLRTLNTLHSEKLLGLTIPSTEDPVAVNKAPSNHLLHPSPPSSSASRCPYSNKSIKAEGAPIVPHHVAMETEQKEVILQTPFGTFHRDDLKQSHVARSAPCSSSSPEPYEMDMRDSKAMPRLSPILKRPGDAIEKDPKLMRLWEYDMRSERSDSLSSSSSLESVDSAYRTISTPGTPRQGTESRSPVPTERTQSALNVPTLKTALSSPPLNLQPPSNTSSPDPVCMMPPKFRMKQSLSGSSTPEAPPKQHLKRPPSAEAAQPPRLPPGATAMPPAGSFPHPFMLYNQYAAAAAFHQHMMMMQQQQQHPDLIEQQGLLPFSMNLSQQNSTQAANLLQIKPEPL